MTPRPFVLLDRDGTIIVERNYLNDPDQVELLPGAARGLRHMTRLGYGLIVITNQSGVGRGFFSAACVHRVHVRMRHLLAKQGAMIDDVVFCPHHPDDGCACRKPRTELVRRVAKRHGFDPSHGYMIGDKECDIALGKAVGASTIVVRTGYGAEHQHRISDVDFVADDLEQAADHIAARHAARLYTGGHERALRL